MHDLSRILLDVRDVGENILSTGKDIQLLLLEANREKIRHSRDLIENILSLCAYLSGLNIDYIDRQEELKDEVRKIEFSCVGLRSALSDGEVIKSNVKEFSNLLRIVEVSSNRIITISFVSKLKPLIYNDEDVCYADKRSCEHSCDGVCYEDEQSDQKDVTKNEHSDTKCSFSENIGDEEVCYKDKVSCEEDCTGSCYLENECDSSFTQTLDVNKGSLFERNINNEEFYHINGIYEDVDKRCPEYSEYFTESPFTHVESGLFEEGESMQGLDVNDNKHSKTINMSEIGEEHIDLSAAIRDSIANLDISYEENDEAGNMPENVDETISSNYWEESNIMEMDNNHHESVDNIFAVEYMENIVDIDDSKSGNDIAPSDIETTSDENTEMELSMEDKKENIESISNENEIQSDDTATEAVPNDYNTEESTTSGYETTTESSYTYTTEDSTTVGYDTTTESYTAEETTTPTYETTTQDMYKLSQDVYSIANDLSSKANEISSLSSDISSKVSSMGSMVSDLNTYDNDELTKTINSVNKLTQEMTSKTSEMSSGCSSMSSLASDIGSAGNDLSSSERHHPIRTTPWQKINSKGQELVTAAQSVVSAAQDILSKLGGVVELAKGLRVAEAVEAAAYEVTAKAQLAISETLGIATTVLELMTSLEG